jgi:very-short-patch-repair endonuclease
MYHAIYEKITNKILDERIIDRPIMRARNYSGIKNKILWKCKKYEYNWICIPDGTINNKINCPKYAGNLKINNEIIDQRLENRAIKRIGNYINSKSKLQFQCLLENCNHIWFANVLSVTNTGNGCPKCGRKTTIEKNKRTQEEVDAILFPRLIKIISQYINNSTYSDFKCLKENCGYQWNAICRNVLNGNRGCPKCAKRLPISIDVVDSKLLAKNIKRLTEFENTQKHMQVQCLLDNYIWSATYNKIIHSNSGCPKCYGNVKHNNDSIDIKLQNENPSVLRKGNFLGKYIKILWGCVDCNYQWEAQPQGIFAGTGCPQCNVTGKNEKLIYELFKNHNIDFKYQKYIRDFSKLENKNYRVDFYLASINLIIEYNGHQHYEPVCFGGMDFSKAEQKFVKQQARDLYVKNFCVENSINLMEIDGRIYRNKKLIKFINDEILPLLNINKKVD